MIDENVGKVIGIYEILNVCDKRDRDGHLLYHVHCTHCTYESNMRLYDIKKSQKCNHKTINGRIIDFKKYWNNQKLGNIFYGIVQRCYNENNKSYRWYGGKGVRICQEWLNNPKFFEEWSLQNGYKDNLTIDRIDENKDYCPENCRWIPFEENVRRAGKVNWITVDNITLTGRQWSEKLGLGLMTINKYIREYGLDKTKELINAILKEPLSTKQRQHCQTWFDVYGI